MAALPKEGSWSVKHLCMGLLDEKDYVTATYWKDKSTEHVLEWLNDCRNESKRRLKFEQKWSVLPNMESVAAHTEQEIAIIGELIEMLGSE